MKNLIINIIFIIFILIMLGSCCFKRTNPIANFEMIHVEGSSFYMGEQALNEGEIDEKPIHYVTLNNFCISKTEVTQKQWHDIMGYLPENLVFGKGDNYPVYNVSWDDIHVFLKKLNKKTDKKFRLPTESEWEYVCRGGKYSNNYKYSGSNELNTVAWYCENSGKKQLKDEEYTYNSLKKNHCITHPVGTLKPNELGVYDMSGNVWEWCSDMYNEYSLSPKENPLVRLKKFEMISKNGVEYVIRGGGFSDVSDRCRISNRGKTSHFTRTCDLGFRLAFSE